MAGKRVVEEWDYVGALKTDESHRDRQRRQGKAFQGVGHRISKGQMAGRSVVFLAF